MASAIARSVTAAISVLARGEVDVDGGADDTGAASDLGHAGVRIARERVDGGVQDRGLAAVGVGAATPTAGSGLVLGGRHLSG